MTSAHELFERGVAAVRQKDVENGQKLLRASLKQDPNNELAWVWLAKTVNNPEKQLKMIERALTVSPGNQQIVAIRDELVRRYQGDEPEAPAQVVTGGIVLADKPSSSKKFVPTPGVKTVQDNLSTEENIRSADLIQKGNAALNHGDAEEAVGYWVQVLDIQVDHPGAFPLIIRQLLQMDYIDDAKELAWRAINAGSPDTSIADVLVRLVRRFHDQLEIEEAYQKLANMPHIHADLKVKFIDEFAETAHPSRVFNVVRAAVDVHPDNQALLLRLAQLYEQAFTDDKALEIYHQIVKINHRSVEGKFADEKLAAVTIPLDDAERGSVLLAVREAVGVLILYFLLAWQDVGLSLFRMDIQHWGGTFLSLAGAYLVVTGSSSHQQVGIAKLLGGEVDPQSESTLPSLDDFTRYMLMAIGGVILTISFYLVFSNAIELLFNPVTPSDIPTVQELLDQVNGGS